MDINQRLTEELKKQILAAETLVAVEDLYRPYRPKRRTRATIAKEKGFDAGSAGTGDSKAKGGKDSESCSCSRASPYRVWKGKTEIQGVSVSEGTANPFLI